MGKNVEEEEEEEEEEIFGEHRQQNCNKIDRDTCSETKEDDVGMLEQKRIMELTCLYSCFMRNAAPLIGDG